MMAQFTRTWELAPAVIDYVVAHLGVDRPRACAVLKDSLLDGRIHAHGLIVGVGETDIDRGFWRFATINSDGSAINLSPMQKLAWFELCADDILRVWPAENGSQIPALPVRRLLEFLEQCPLKSKKLELRRLATNHFKGYHISDDRFQEAYKLLPGEYRRTKGETERTINRQKS